MYVFICMRDFNDHTLEYTSEGWVATARGAGVLYEESEYYSQGVNRFLLS